MINKDFFQALDDLEVQKGKLTVKITKMNQKLQKMDVVDETHHIGFQIPDYEEDEEEDEDV